MENPSKYVKIAVLQALVNGGIANTWYKRKPKSNNASQYAIVTSIDKNPIDRGKECFDWSVQVVIDLWAIGAQGFPPADNALEDMEQIVMEAMSSIRVYGYTVYDSMLTQAQDLSVETDTQSIERKAISWELQLNNREKRLVLFNDIINAMPYYADKPFVVNAALW